MKRILVPATILVASSLQAAELPKIDVSGYIQTIMTYSNTEHDGEKAKNEIEIYDSAIEFIGTASKYVSGNLNLLYTDADSLAVDVASVTYSKNNFSAKAGLDYVKFGQQTTNMITDPGTLDLGELQETLVEASYSIKGLTATVTAFRPNYEYNENSGYAYGADLNYSSKCKDLEFTIGASFLSNINDSGLFEAEGYDASTDPKYDEEISAYAAYTQINFKDFGFIAEYMETSKQVSFTDGAPGSFSKGEKGKTLQVEASYGFEIMGHATTVALGWLNNDKGYIGDYEDKYLGSVSYEMDENNSFTFEYHTQEDANSIETNGASLLYAVGF